MDKIQLVKDWLETFPDWNDAQWEVDVQGVCPVSYRLTLEDDRVMRQTADVLGQQRFSMQAQFSLIRVSYAEENVGEVIEHLNSWILEQSFLGTTAELGDGLTYYRTEKGKLEIMGDKAVYHVKLIGTYEKIF